MKVAVPVSKANRLVNCGNTVLVSSHDKEKPNIMVAAWQMPVSHDPMMMGIAIGKPNYTHDIIMETREFVVNTPTSDIINEVMICGKKSGRDINKFTESGLTPIPAEKVKVPLVKECIGHIEVADVEAIPAGDHTIFIGPVVAASATEGLFVDGTWNLDNPEVTLIFHWGGLNFTTPGPKVSL